MFPQLRKIDNESGVVLYVVLMTAIIIMIFSIGILTQSLNENNYAQQQIDQIVSDQLGKGVFWNQYSSSFNAGNIVKMQNEVYATVINNRTYDVNLTNTAAGSYNVVANYDTFQ